MKNKNRKKSIIIAIVVVVLCLVGYKIADKVSYPLVRAKAVLYLADKYDAKISDFEMTDYNHSNFFWSDKLIFIPVLKMTDFSFEFLLLLVTTDISMTIFSFLMWNIGAHNGLSKMLIIG